MEERSLQDCSRKFCKVYLEQTAHSTVFKVNKSLTNRIWSGRVVGVDYRSIEAIFGPVDGFHEALETIFNVPPRQLLDHLAVGVRLIHRELKSGIFLDWNRWRHRDIDVLSVHDTIISYSFVVVIQLLVVENEVWVCNLAKHLLGFVQRSLQKKNDELRAR